MANVLVVDDEKEMRDLLAIILQQRGHQSAVASDGKSALEQVKEFLPDLVVLDFKLPDMDGIEVLSKIKSLSAGTEVIIITGYGDTDIALRAGRSGAYDFMSKPVEAESFAFKVDKALQAQKLSRQVAFLKGELRKEVNLEHLMGNSAKVQDVLQQIKIVAPTDATVLLQGESGTGKELTARGIHRYSKRKNKPFVVVDCGTLPETLIESELFGYEKGAFTGAAEKKCGQFELADGGTLFLDEISNLSFSAQRKLLRVLQERKVQHLGGKKTITVDVRIIAATNINLWQAVKEGMFREDLYHRLDEFPINVPPLRERKADVVFLVRRFMEEANLEFNKKVESVSRGALKCLMSYSWPGNVRELKNVVKRAVLLADRVVLPRHISLSLGADSADHGLGGEVDFADGDFSLRAVAKKAAEHAEKKVIEKALREAAGNKSKVARILKIDRSTLYHKMRSLGL